MTRFTPLWQQAGSYPANYDRALLATMWPAPAATGAAATAVTNTMNVSIPAGSIAVPLQSGQHTALCRWDAAEVVSSTAAPAAGNSRIDMIVAQVRDPQLDAGANNDFIFVVLAGTPATSNPVTPTVPANAAPICTYTVVGGSANLNGVTINDQRRGSGTTPVFATTTERDTVWPGAPNGAMCITLDTGEIWQRNGGAWTPPPKLARGILSKVYCPASDQSGFGAAQADIAGSTIGFNATASRTYAISMQFVVTCTAACAMNLYLMTAGGAQVARSIENIAAGAYHTFTVRHMLTGLSGTGLFYKAQISFSAGSGTVMNMNGYMLVEDLGT